MNLLINGMNMPKNCKDCPCREYGKFSYEPDWCCLNRKNIVNAETISPNCPLSEIPSPHGRLIDADRLYETIEQMEGFGTIDNENDVVLSAVEVLTVIDEAPTIIEAEE